MQNKFGYDIDSNYNPNPYKYRSYILRYITWIRKENKSEDCGQTQ